MSVELVELLSFVSAREQTLAHAETKRECSLTLCIFISAGRRAEQQNKTYSFYLRAHDGLYERAHTEGFSASLGWLSSHTQNVI